MSRQPEFSSLEKYLPHRPPMILIDNILTSQSEHFSCGLAITEQSLGYAKGLGGVPSWFGIEYMAQTIAAFNGVHGSETNQAKPHEVEIGFLIGIRNYQVKHPLFPLDARLEIHVAADLVMNNSGSFQCKILQNGCELASGSLTTYKPDNETLEKLKASPPRRHL